MLLPFLLFVNIVLGSNKEATADDTLPAKKLPDPRTDPGHPETRFIEANFFQDYILYIKDMLKEKDENAWIDYMRFFFVLPGLEKDFINVRNLDADVIVKMQKLISLDATFKIVSYLMALKVRPVLPSISFEEVLRDHSKLGNYVEYFLEVVNNILCEKVPESPKRYLKLIEKRSVLLDGALSTWFSAFRLHQLRLAPELLKKMKEIGRILIKENEDDIYQYKGREVILYCYTEFLSDVVGSEVNLPAKGFLLYPLYDFARYNQTLKQGLDSIQVSLEKLHGALKYNSKKIEDDFDEYDIFREKLGRLLNLKFLEVKDQDTSEIRQTKISVKEQILSLVGPLQKYLPQFKRPTSLDSLIVQLVHERRFLQRMRNTMDYPDRLYSVLTNAHMHKVRSVKALTSSLNNFYKGNYEFKLRVLENIPEVYDPKTTWCSFVGVIDPKEFKSSFLSLGIPEGAIIDVSHVASDEDTRIAFQTIGDLLSSLAYKLFSFLYLKRSGLDVVGIPILTEKDPVLRKEEIERIYSHNFGSFKKYAYNVANSIQNEQEKEFIKTYIKLIDVWIMSKCYYLFYELDPQLAIEKTSKIFVIPAKRAISGDHWYLVEFILMQKSDDPAWKPVQFNLVSLFEQIMRYMREQGTQKNIH